VQAPHAHDLRIIMKSVPALLGCSLLLAPLAAALRAEPIDSRISAATVYADRAVVTRAASVELAAGEHALVFGSLPAELIDQSLRASGHGTAAVTILDVNAQTAFLEAAPNARVKELEDRIRGLKQQQRSLDDRARTLAEEREFVKRMLAASTGTVIYPLGDARGGGTAARPTLDEWQKLYSYSEDAFGRIATELQSLDTQREDLRARQEALEQQLNELRGATGKSVKSVTVRVDVTKPGRLELALDYAVPGATWAPAYDARLRAADRAVELSYFGLVRNTTGEDWNAIALTLSTARPSLGGAAPELSPWIVDVARPVAADEQVVRLSPFAVEGGRQARRAVAKAVMEEAAPAAAPEPEREAGTIAAAVETGATSATFKIPVAVTVAANNTVQKVPIATAKLAADLEYQAAPKLLEAAFLSARAVNTTDYPLLAGAMNTFLDDTFVAASQLKTVMPGEKFELALGADEGIAVKRRLVNRFSENTGLTSRGRRVTYDILVTITNNKRTPERVIFREPVPVSRNEKIEVNLITPAERDIGTPDKPKEVTREEDGRLAWRLELKPGEKREIPFKFSVGYPADLNVTGLE